jgi:hypothetical protein
MNRVSQLLKCMAHGSALPSLFVSQGLLKVALFLAPASIVYFRSVGYTTWLAALVVGSEVYLMVKTALAMSTCSHWRSGTCAHAS